MGVARCCHVRSGEPAMLCAYAYLHTSVPYRVVQCYAYLDTSTWYKHPSYRDTAFGTDFWLMAVPETAFSRLTLGKSL
eukprot:3404860-Rhodomonas_salina.1